jgi:hypothetical protein
MSSRLRKAPDGVSVARVRRAGLIRDGKRPEALRAHRALEGFT